VGSVVNTLLVRHLALVVIGLVVVLVISGQLARA